MNNPPVKHLEMPCISGTDKNPCKVRAFVQVVIVDDKKLQQKVDARASEKMSKQLSKEHNEGLHNVKSL